MLSRANRIRNERGFTLVELLVVIAIIGVLVALLLPAVQAAREAARRTDCTNRMKQFGLALHNYHDTHSVFPPAQIDSSSCTAGFKPTTGSNLNGLVLLLPFMEQSNLHDTLDFGSAFDDYNPAGISLAGGGAAANGAKINIELAMFTCPSDIGPSGASTSTTYNPPSGTPDQRTNYDFIVYYANYNTCSYWSQRGIERTMFDDNSRCRFADISDGTSNTVAMAETRKACCSNGSNANWGGRGWVQNGLSLRYSAPNNVTAGTQRLANWAYTGSFHPGGMQVLLGDASVRFMPDTIDALVRTNLERIGDGAVVQSW